jgi:hypothetical protein
MIFPPENRQNGPAPKIGDGVRHDSKINALTVVNKPNLFEGEHASQQSSGAGVSAIAAACSDPAVRCKRGWAWLSLGQWLGCL